MNEAAGLTPVRRGGETGAESNARSTDDERFVDEQRAIQRALGLAYTVEREIGRGGMATVYLARDRKHGRPVAVKVLHPEIAAAYGAARFLTEIEVTATLQHPHILGFIDSGVVAGNADGVGARPYYVMPYVDGESLRGRLDREGQLGVSDAVRITCDVASALEYAHRRGIIHRDVKPENILLHDGRAVVADFGIALPMSDERRPRLTQTGIAIGTPEYMSPEQAMGERVIDARADVYALGAVTYEMLTGEPPYTGPTLQAIAARIMSEPPRGIRAQRPAVPAGLEAAVLRALEKLPADRFPSAAAYATAVEDGVVADNVRSAVPGRLRARDWKLFAVGAATGVALLGASAWIRTTRPARNHPAQGITATLLPPDGVEFAGGMGMTLTPDGSKLAFVARHAGTPAHLYVRTLASGATAELPGTDNADAPFWSPDGSTLGFFAGGQLRVIDASGAGAAHSIAAAPEPRGGAWADDGTIIFGADTTGVLYRVAAVGGTPQAITKRGSEGAHSRPALHPDGRHFVFHAAGRSGIFLGDLRTGKTVQLTSRGASAAFAAADYLVYDPARPGTMPQNDQLAAQRIDVGHGRLVGPVVIVAEDVAAPLFLTSYAVSASGTLVFQPWGAASPLTWSDRRGVLLDSISSADIRSFRLSRDGSRLAYSDEGGLWVRDLGRNLVVKLPTKSNVVLHPVWSADGQRIAYGLFTADGANRRAIITRLDDKGSDLEVPLPPSRGRLEDWSPDGKMLLTAGAPSRDAPYNSLWTTDVRSGAVRQWLAAQGNVEGGRFSPDEHWVAYQSDETGAPEVYVRPFPGPGAVVRISPAGGAKPMWRRDGRELYYLTPDGDLAVVSVTADDALDISKPRVLIRGASRRPFARGASYQPTPDGDRFLLNDARTVSPPLTLRVPWMQRPEGS